MMSNEHGAPQDPLNLDAVDRDIRISELEEKLLALGLGTLATSEACSPETREQFLRQMLEYETAPKGTYFARLIKSGVSLPRPDSLDDGALNTKLWEVIRALAAMDVYLYHTNHMSDRQLYEHLWGDSLREVAMMMPPGSGWAYHIDTLGSGSEESIEISLRYYDNEESRQRWVREFPKTVLPPHEDPPFDRDKDLPKAPPMVPPDEDGEWDEEPGVDEPGKG
jgi:hypothetical protein